jgi:hypothetical protein
LVSSIKKFLNTKAVVLPIPLWILLPAAQIVQKILGYKNPIHPVRVKKAATPTHIIPQALKDYGFNFKYDFLKSLIHWQADNPEDFESLLSGPIAPETTKIKMVRGAESSVGIRTAPQPEMTMVEQEEEIKV